jgi:oligosaccharide repeat unit polymerase
MNMTGAIFLASLLFATWFMFERLRVNFTLSSVGLLLLLTFHGPAYWFYTRYWIHGTSFLNKIYDRSAESVASGGTSSGILPPTIAPAYDHLARLSGDPAFGASMANLDIAMALLFLGTVLGFFLADRVVGNDQSQISAAIISWQNSRLSSSLKQRGAKVVFWSLVAICSIALVFLYLQTDKFDLVYRYFFIAGNEVEKIKWRRESGGFSYFWNLFFSTIAIFATVYAINEVRFNKLIGFLFALSFIALIIFGKMAYLSKAPVVVYALQICLAFIIARSLNVSKYAATSLLAILVCGALLMVFVANSSMHGLGNALIFLFYRLLMIPNESLVEYFLAIPNYISHTYGLDNRFIAFASGQPKLLESYWRVAEVLRGVGGSTTTAMFIGDSWAEFSWAGVIIFPIVFGGLLRCLDILLIRKLGKTSASIAGLSLGYYGIFIALSTSLFTALLTGGILMIPFLVIIGGFAPSWASAKTSAAS